MRVPSAALLLLILAAAGPARAGDAGPGFPLDPAAPLDPTPFLYALPVRAHPSPAGVTRLRLSPAVLAVARDDLADLRVIDGASRQWPFVLIPDAGRETLALRGESVQVEPGHSRWRLVPPVAPVVLDGLTLRVARERFDRAYRLLGELPGGLTTTLATGHLARSAGQAAELTVEMPPTRVAALALVVDDGDEAPLPLAEAKAPSPVAELRLVAPAGDYTLLAGDVETRAPRYEIAGVQAQVLAAPAGEAELGAVGANAAHRPRLPRGEARDQLALWVVMGVAVATLGALALRLARREKGKAGEGKAGEGKRGE